MAIALGWYGNKLWFVLGCGFTVGLMVLSLVCFMHVKWQKRLRKKPILGYLIGDRFFVVLFVFAIIVLRIPGLTHLQLNPDESGLILGARTLLHDPRFWISFDNTTLGPVSTFVVALPGLLGFTVDYTSIKVIAIFTWCIVGVLMFLGFRNLYNGTLARLFVLPLVLTAATFNFWDYVAFNGEHMPVLLLAFGFWMHAGFLRNGSEVQPVRALLLGIALALVPLAKIQPGPLAFAWGVSACLLSLKAALRRVFWIVLGAVTPLIVLAIYLTASGAWHDFIQSYLLNNLLYASDGWNARHADMTFLENALKAPDFFFRPRDSRGLFGICLLVGGVGVASAMLNVRIRQRIFRSDVVLSLIICIAAAVCVIMPKNNWTHYLLLLFVPVSMFTAAVLAVIFEHIQEREATIEFEFRHPDRRWRVSGVAAVALLIAVLGGFLSPVYTMKAGNSGIRKAEVNLARGTKPGSVAEGILRHALPGEPVAHWGVLLSEVCEAGVSLGTRDAHNERALYPSTQQEYYLQRWTTDLLIRKPRFVVDSGSGKKFEHFRLENFPREWAVVSSLYELLEEIDGFRIFCMKSVCTAGDREQ